MISERDKQLLLEVLWDTDIEKIDLLKNKRSIIERILVYGRPEHIEWLLKNYKDNDLVNAIKKSKNLDEKTKNYWSIRLNIR